MPHKRRFPRQHGRLNPERQIHHPRHPRHASARPFKADTHLRHQCPNTIDPTTTKPLNHATEDMPSHMILHPRPGVRDAHNPRERQSPDWLYPEPVKRAGHAVAIAPINSKTSAIAAPSLSLSMCRSAFISGQFIPHAPLDPPTFCSYNVRSTRPAPRPSKKRGNHPCQPSPPISGFVFSFFSRPLSTFRIHNSTFSSSPASTGHSPPTKGQPMIPLSRKDLHSHPQKPNETTRCLSINPNHARPPRPPPFSAQKPNGTTRCPFINPPTLASPGHHYKRSRMHASGGHHRFHSKNPTDYLATLPFPPLPTSAYTAPQTPAPCPAHTAGHQTPQSTAPLHDAD